MTQDPVYRNGFFFQGQNNLGSAMRKMEMETSSLWTALYVCSGLIPQSGPVIQDYVNHVFFPSIFVCLFLIFLPKEVSWHVSRMRRCMLTWYRGDKSHSCPFVLFRVIFFLMPHTLSPAVLVCVFCDFYLRITKWKQFLKCNSFVY